MYEDFYGMRCKPFQLNPDPSFYFGSKQHRRAKAYLEYGLLREEGFIVITGEIGAGKTTLVRGLLDGLNSDKVVAAQLVSTQLDAEDMLQMVGAAFGVHTNGASKADLIRSLEIFFVSQRGQGKRCLLVVDEAQNLTLRAVEELRMLSNFQFGEQGVLQSFLVGQPEFRATLQKSSMQQLKQRVIAACHIGPLDFQETQEYISHRLEVSGATAPPSFDSSASEIIAKVCGGIPRKINLLCDRLLLQAFLKNSYLISEQEVIDVLQEINEEQAGYFGSPDAPLMSDSETSCPTSNREIKNHSEKKAVELGTQSEHAFREKEYQRVELSISHIEQTVCELLQAIKRLETHFTSSQTKASP